MTTRSTAVCLKPYAVTNPLADVAQFFREYIRNPRSVAAITPSGRALAALITREVSALTGPVLELGAGTGALTRALIERGVPQERLTLIESHPPFADLLRRRYPDAAVVDTNAADLDALPAARFGAVICGLGLLNMDYVVVEAILRGAFLRMRSGAGFYLFTYGRGCSVSDTLLDRLGLVASRVGGTLFNIPPASVYRIEQSPAGAERC